MHTEQERAETSTSAAGAGTAEEPAFDPRPLVIEPLELGVGAHEPPRTHRFRVVRVEEGQGTFCADAGRHPFSPGSMLFTTPYQHLRFEVATPTRAKLIEFHANFLCVETFHAEVGCRSALFNDPCGVPAIVLSETLKDEVDWLLARIEREQQTRGLAHDEASVGYMKLVLILATRVKLAEGLPTAAEGGIDSRDPLLGRLRAAIEANYRTHHAPSDYAALLHVTPKTLGRIVRERLGKTLTELIQERVLIHAKWQLLHTLRPIGEIAHELGFADELYFSRLFKKRTGVSPRFFRAFETKLRGGSNLSMTPGPPPMAEPPAREPS